MIEKLDITEIVNNEQPKKIKEQQITLKLEREFPYITYMPIRKGTKKENGKTYLMIDVVSDGF